LKLLMFFFFTTTILDHVSVHRPKSVTDKKI
jgi:hypothetical protein